MLERWLGIDPGKATGWSIWCHREDAPLQRESFGVVTNGVYGVAEALGGLTYGVDVVICEKFDLDSRTKSPGLEPKLIEGALILHCWQRGVELVFSRKDQKARVKDAAIKAAGLWVKGRAVDWTDGRDVNDSTKHVLAYALDQEVHQQAQPTARWLFPPR